MDFWKAEHLKIILLDNTGKHGGFIRIINYILQVVLRL